MLKDRVVKEGPARLQHPTGPLSCRSDPDCRAKTGNPNIRVPRSKPGTHEEMSRGLITSMASHPTSLYSSCHSVDEVCCHKHAVDKETMFCIPSAIPEASCVK
ncbi:hypothetical protein MUK42_12296 [Musa troglodytarum]|uniref:Uncharacterized protein n=1 Tax=Musa troglodytarum TaxID=320322 RepID=A0A9E7GWJ3_9LILI|nr:hypothetical protein MUK42_12296 [Musa troglodytarum]